MPYDFPKYGHPRTEAQRRKRHKGLHGKGSKVPKRGTGKKFTAQAMEALSRRG